MKKLIAVLLLSALALSVCSCSQDAINDTIGDTINDAINDTIDQAISNTVDNIKENIEKKISRGTVEGNVYKSDFSGITFTKPDDWKFHTDEEIAANMNISAEMLGQDKFSEAIASAASMMDMQSSNPLTGDNISIIYENLALSGNQNITLAEYLEVTKSQFAALEGFNYEFQNDFTKTLGNHEYRGAIHEANYNGVKLTQSSYFRKEGDYMVVITITLTSLDSFEEIEKMIS